jgi:uracil-DNA glycosylase
VVLPKELQTSLMFEEGQAARMTSWAPASWSVAHDWRPVVDRFLATAAAQQLGEFVQTRLDSGALIYPPQPFRALELTPLEQVRVVILGQDPYHGAGQAHGLAFSVSQGVTVPPSLRNIFKEIARDPLLNLGSCAPLANGSLERWARQGVLLLNTCLTVEDAKPASHAKQGWEVLTDFVISAVLERSKSMVFMLWGAHAQAKRALMESVEKANRGPQTSSRAQALSSEPSLLVLAANHPSPLSALRPPLPFAGCGHFGLANQFLVQHGHPAIDW